MRGISVVDQLEGGFRLLLLFVREMEEEEDVHGHTSRDVTNAGGGR